MNKKKQQEIIKKSHARSLMFGIEKNIQISKKILRNNELKLTLEQSQELLEITAPIINEMFDFLKGSGFIIILTDPAGCIVKIIGDEVTMEEASKQNLVTGAFMDEKSIGTNAMGTAISENMPVQITAKEHFISAFHKWTCSAAPIHDLSGNLIGVLNLTGNSELMHPHTLGLVVAAVSAVESRLQNNFIQHQLHNSNEFAFAMMNNLSYGMFAIDMNDDILWVNDMACRSLNIRRLHLINKSITQFFTDWQKVKQIILLEQTYTDEEGHFNLPNLKEKYLFNAYLIKTKTNEILGFLFTFRELRRVMKIVNKYAGYHTHYSFDNFIGESQKIKSIIKYCKTISKNSSTVLITGESGTGKEIIAQSIHNLSNRREAAFVAVNCGAISESLIESELFGYVEGAFTGALKGGRPGKFELADRGTLFLDEIGEMPLNMQVKLLRALQEKSVMRVGNDKPIPVNVRIIAATNKNLEEEVQNGHFRLDLYYRLNVLEIKIPPLRERKEDILPLVRYFLKKKSAKFDKPIPELSPELLNNLLEYKWHGNIRELENWIERVVILDGNTTFDNLIKKSNEKLPKIPQQETNTVSELPVIWNLEENEKKIIKEALVKFESNISKIANALGISRNTLYLKIKKYNITSPKLS